MENRSRHHALTAATPARALIVEDEEHARRYLRELLDDNSEIKVVGESSNGVQGIEQIRELSPDIVFADIQMPGLDGLGMIDQIAETQRPLWIVVTGYSEYAVKAFEIEALDYLCKPFDKERIAISVERALRRLNSAVPSRSEGQWLSRLSIKDNEHILFLPVDEIVWIEAANKYVVIHTPTGSHISRQTIQSLEDQLNPREFVEPTGRLSCARPQCVACSLCFTGTTS